MPLTDLLFIASYKAILHNADESNLAFPFFSATEQARNRPVTSHRIVCELPSWLSHKAFSSITLLSD